MQAVLITSSALSWVVLLLNLLLTLAIIRKMNAGSQISQIGLKPSTQVPAFTAQALNGDVVTQDSLIGKMTLLIFISPDCGPCKEALPKYKDLYIKTQQLGMEMFLVSVGDLERTRELVDQFSLTQPVLIAPKESNPFMKDYQIAGTPEYTLVDAKGQVQSTGIPSLDWGEFGKLLKSLEKTATHPGSGAQEQ
jgi:peroxiredoxin